MAITTASPVIYPDSDGQPMAENTRQFEWIVTIQGNLDLAFLDRDNVLVAGDNLIYPVEGDPTVRAAPDVYVAFGRPKGHRGSYRVWEEDGIFPQVIFEILSPGNRTQEMARKFTFYQRFGTEEYYLYDPDHNDLSGFIRKGQILDDVPRMDGFVSPLLGIRFECNADDLVIRHADGTPFRTFVELGQFAKQSEIENKINIAAVKLATARAEEFEAEAARAKSQAEEERDRAQHEQMRAERYRQKLLELGLDPNGDS